MLYNVDRLEKSLCYLRYNKCDFSMVCISVLSLHALALLCLNPNYCVHKTVLNVTITKLCYDCENRFKCFINSI